jgi:hypothetical protein
MSTDNEVLVLVTDEHSDENLAMIISDLYETIRSTAGVIETCAGRFGWLGWDPPAEGEKANATLQRAAVAGDEERRKHVAELCEVLEGECSILQQYVELLRPRPTLVMTEKIVESTLTRTGLLLERARPYRA